MSSFDLRRGGGPLLVSMPHIGTVLPPELVPRLTEEALQLVDTDWRVDELYDFLHTLDLSVLTPRYSRYLVDLNRPPGGESLYPGQTVSEICPLRSFAGKELYRPGEQPRNDEVEQRIEHYWLPYHQALHAELDRLKSLHGFAILWDAHSIRSVVPGLFSGELPDFNFGTADGKSCEAGLLTALEAVVAGHPAWSWVSNDRFKGGAITRIYGSPARGVHAVQLELSQATYLVEEPPFPVCRQRAPLVRPILRALIDTTLNWKPSMAGALS
jgi:N-formylglutamate deformylase